MGETSFLVKAKAAHGDRYDYSEVDYKNNTSKVSILCKKHGRFYQAPVKHQRGQNCPRCAGNKKLSLRDFTKRAVTVHGNKYNYTAAVYIDIDTKIEIVCPIHGNFWQSPYEHLKGHECYLCGNGCISRDDFIGLAADKYGDKYDYSKVIYKNKKSKIVIGCKIHGLFEQTPLKHLANKSFGCAKCVIDSRKSTTAAFITAARQIHGDRYDYSVANYISAMIGVDVICKNHGLFNQTANDHLGGHGCPRCQTVISGGHAELLTMIPVDFVINDRHMIPPYEIDVYIPEFKVGIEYNGCYWHGLNNKTKHSHQDYKLKHSLKFEAARKAGIKLYQIFDFEFLRHKELIRSMVLNSIGMSNRVYARKCNIVVGDFAGFFDSNHIQGNRPAAIQVGLRSDNAIIAAASFAPHRLYGYEIIRYCCLQNTTVVGGFSKILNWFVVNYKPTSILSYSDRRFGVGNVYSKTGFKNIGNTKPDYFYMKGNIIKSRYQCQKHRLAKLLGVSFDHNVSETKNMLNAGYTKCYGAGHDKWVLEL